MDFAALVQNIQTTHEHFAAQAARAVNIGLTLRNWVVGLYISEFELSGADRAKYGEKLLDELSSELKRLKVVNTGRRQLYQYLAFYRAYPEMAQLLPTQSQSLLPQTDRVQAIVRTASAQLKNLETLVNQMSYSHFELLLGLADEQRRRFYQEESLKGQWSVRELRRQISSLLFERSALSTNKVKLEEHIRQTAEVNSARLSIRDPYVFEFLGLKPKEVLVESELEDALLNKIQDFLLELGKGFCFEARQKRLLIGDDFFFVDLVFYHRILKCHVLIELKADEFKHEHIGQLNTYVNWYKKNEMNTGDNPPVGILLCAYKNHALLEYALGSMDNSSLSLAISWSFLPKKSWRSFCARSLDRLHQKAKPLEAKQRFYF